MNIGDVKSKCIISGFNLATYHSSKYIDIVLDKLVKSVTTNLKNSTNTDEGGRLDSLKQVFSSFKA
jgi:hypothetical protein